MLTENVILRLVLTNVDYVRVCFLSLVFTNVDGYLHSFSGGSFIWTHSGKSFIWIPSGRLWPFGHILVDHSVGLVLPGRL